MVEEKKVINESECVNQDPSEAVSRKVHPRMYEVATIDFHNEVVNGDITMDIPYSVRNTIMKAIEDLGYSITFNYNDSVTVNAVKKQLQHDA